MINFQCMNLKNINCLKNSQEIHFNSIIAIKITLSTETITVVLYIEIFLEILLR